MKRKRGSIRSTVETSGKEKEKKTIQWEKVAVSLALLFLMTLGISSFFPTQRLWGVNHLSYYPFWIRALLIFSGVVVFIPLVNRGIRKVLKKSAIPAFNFLAEKRKYLGYSIIILLFVLFFYLFRIRTHFLGDSAQILSDINTGTLSVKWTQPLTIQIYLSAYDFLNRFFHFDGEVVYAWISYLCGVIFVFFALRLADLLGKATSTKLFVFLTLTFMGGTQLFLGYAEHYSLFYCGTLIYLFFSIKCLKGEIKLFLPILFFLILLPIHLFSIYLFPSALFLFLFTGGEEKAKPILRIRRIWIVLSVLILFLACLILYFWKYGWYSVKYFIPLSSGNYYAPNYTLFSLTHLLDLLNQQLLVSPIGFLLFLVFLILRPIGAKRRSRHLGGEGLNLKDKTFQFLLTVAIAQLCFNFILDPGLGAARDWDLFASVGIGYTLLALWIFGKMSPNPKISYLKLVLTIIVLISILPWIGINASADLSVKRFRNLLDLDPKRSLNGHYVLADYFETLGKPEEVKREERIQMEKFPEASLVNGGLKLLEKGELNNAYQKFIRALQIAPNFPEVHWALGEYYYKRDNLEKAEGELLKAIDLRADHATAYALLGIIYSLKKDLKRARKMLERALVLGARDEEIYHNLGNVYWSSRNFNKAIHAYQKAIQIDDEFAEPHFGLSLALFQQGKLQKSLEEVNRALKIKPDFAPAYYQLAMIYKSQGKKDQSISAFKKYLELEPNGSAGKKVRELIEELEKE